MIDEAHLLNDCPRGATLEAAVSRMQTMHEGLDSQIRFVAISATIPNIEDLSAWINAGSSQSVGEHKFGESYRPVKLQVSVESYSSSGNPWIFDKVLNKKVADVLTKYNPDLRPTLVFCSTRKGYVLAPYISRDTVRGLLEYNIKQ
jgi:ATP-dependent DNA helicase HFM1/MER3